MDNYNRKIKFLIDNFCEVIFKNPNVTGFGRGRKIINGSFTNIPSLTILVEKKLSPNMIHPDNFIPKQFYGAVTDIIETKKLTVHSTPSLVSPHTLTPAVGGLPIYLWEGERTGTLGYAVTDIETHSKLYILTCRHVFESKKTPPPRKVCIDVNKTPYTIGTVGAVIPLREYVKGNYNIFNEVDAGLALVGKNDIATQSTILCPSLLGTSIKGVKELDLNEEVVKLGATTGFTSGIILSKDSTTLVGTRLFKNQIISSPMSSGGDSGSIGLSKTEPYAFGLLIGGSNTISIYSPISKVLDMLHVEFAKPLTNNCQGKASPTK